MSDGFFAPNWISAPGGTILDILEEREISSRELAKLLGYTLDRTEKLLAGREAITSDVAKLLADKLGGTEHFWISREGNYRNEVARLQATGNPTAAKAWLDELPLKDMRKFGWITSQTDLNETVSSCLRFFDSKNVKEWRHCYGQLLSAVSFRTSPTFKSEPGAVLSWLRFGEIQSNKLACNEWNKEGFSKSLADIRRLTRKKDPTIFVPELRQLCAKFGVALVIARTPSGCCASGATRFLTQKKAMILLSFRHLTDDQFWFTFFHEAGHLILHSDKALFLEDGSEVSQHEEKEANTFAQGVLVPDQSRTELLSLKANKNEIMKFAVKVGVSRGIIVGQLQHEKKLRSDQLNWMKRRYKVDDLSRIH